MRKYCALLVCFVFFSVFGTDHVADFDVLYNNKIMNVHFTASSDFRIIARSGKVTFDLLAFNGNMVYSEYIC